jgi:hypothetical protein
VRYFLKSSGVFRMPRNAQTAISPNLLEHTLHLLCEFKPTAFLSAMDGILQPTHDGRCLMNSHVSKSRVETVQQTEYDIPSTTKFFFPGVAYLANHVTGTGRSSLGMHSVDSQLWTTANQPCRRASGQGFLVTPDRQVSFRPHSPGV